MRQVFLGSLMGFGVVGFRTLPLVSAFILVPLHTFFFAFVSYPSVFMPWHLILSPFAHTLVRPYTKPSFEVAQVVIMRSGSFVCSWSLGSVSSQPDTPGLSCPPFVSSFVCLVCARTRTIVVPLSSLGGVCVAPLESQGFLRICFPFLTAGGMAAVSLATPTKLWSSAGRECACTLLYLQF